MASSSTTHALSVDIGTMPACWHEIPVGILCTLMARTHVRTYERPKSELLSARSAHYTGVWMAL